MDEDKLSLREQFSRIHGLFHRYRMQNCHARGPMADPYQGQGRILRLLQMRPEISQKDLSYLLGMRPQSLGELLAKLERGGFVTRTPMESDRRAMNIRLTEKGAEAANQIEPPSDSDSFFASLSEEERAALSGYLDRIISDMEGKIGSEQDDSKCGCHGERGHGEPRRGHEYGEQCHGHEHREQCHGHERAEQCHGREHIEQCNGHERVEQCHGHEHGEHRHGHGGCSHRHWRG